MLIRKSLFDEISSKLIDTHFESGGVLGEKDGIISFITYDKGLCNVRCSYEPDVDLLNNTIEIWQKQRINFAGIFHTHFFGVTTLSDCDISYIETIMMAMPKEINSLYFPIVLPESSTIIPYLAVRAKHGIDIRTDKIQFIE